MQVLKRALRISWPHPFTLTNESTKTQCQLRGRERDYVVGLFELRLVAAHLFNNVLLMEHDVAFKCANIQTITMGNIPSFRFSICKAGTLLSSRTISVNTCVLKCFSYCASETNATVSGARIQK